MAPGQPHRGGRPAAAGAGPLPAGQRHRARALRLAKAPCSAPRALTSMPSTNTTRPWPRWKRRSGVPFVNPEDAHVTSHQVRTLRSPSSIVVAGGLFALTAAKRGKSATEVRLDTVKPQDLVAVGHGQRQDRAEDQGGHQRRHHRPHHADRGQGRRLGQEGAVPAPDRPGAVRGGGERGSRRLLLGVRRPRRCRPRPTATRPSARCDRARSSAASSPNLISPEAVEQAQTGVRRGRGQPERRQRARWTQARAALQEAQDQPGQDPAHLPDRRPGHPARRRGGRSRRARHLLAGDRRSS